MNTPFEKKICYTLCVCELTAVLSCVSIFYLTFAVYLPSYREMNAGFSETTVMCTTLSNITLEDCDAQSAPGKAWSSCGEWCLSKSGGACSQIRVDVRSNGTNVRLEDCETELEDVVYCDGIDPKQEAAECIIGGCRDLTGLYNCSIAPVSAGVTEATHGAYCRDMTTVLGCNLTSVDPEIHCKNKKACYRLDGLYLCRKGRCRRVRPPFKCEKKCNGIQTGGKSVIVRENDVVFTAKCKRAVEIETNEEIWPKDLQASGNNSDSQPPVLVLFCTSITDRQKNLTEIRMVDCFNGTLMEPATLGDTTDIVRLVKMHTENMRLVDPTKQFVMPESDLLLSHNVPLQINFEGCVNTLILKECEKFLIEYGVDGSDLRANARFPCFYRPHLTDATDDSNFVILRYDLEKTVMELLLATTVPITLAVISCFMLIFCSRVIHMHEDTHFFFKMCNKVYKPELENKI